MSFGSVRANFGSLIISLDFELYWGVRDKRGLDEYRLNLTGVHDVVPKLLGLFERFSIRATWATVGFLHFEDKKSLLAAFPEQLPSYSEKKFSPYPYIENGVLEHKMHFAPSLIDLIGNAKGQELASHTYSHFYCLEKGQTAEQFSADCTAYKELATSKGLDLSSIVFPRNQVNPDYCHILQEHGISVYRGTEDNRLNDALAEQNASLSVRALRFLDAYLGITGANSYSLEESVKGGLVNLRASRFLRPYSNALRVLEPIKLARVKKAMTHAAKRGEVFHLWWHPHNFGVNQQQNLNGLEQILSHYQYLHSKYGMQSLNMRDAAELARQM